MQNNAKLSKQLTNQKCKRQAKLLSFYAKDYHKYTKLGSILLATKLGNKITNTITNIFKSLKQETYRLMH